MLFRSLLNREVIAIDQDRAGKQANRVLQSGEQEVWTRELAGGDFAVALFNRAEEPAQMKVEWAKTGMKKMPQRVRDLWTHHDIELHGRVYAAEVPGHGVVLMRVR